MASGVGEEEDMGFPVAERFCLCFLVSVWLFPGAVSNGSRAMIENHLLISSVFVYVDRFILRCEYNYASRLRRVITYTTPPTLTPHLL